LKESTTRWIATGAAGTLWGATIATGFVIQPHDQMFQTVWLATLIASLIAVICWVTRPDHGRLAHLRLEGALRRLEHAIIEEVPTGRGERPSHGDSRMKGVA